MNNTDNKNTYSAEELNLIFDYSQDAINHIVKKSIEKLPFYEQLFLLPGNSLICTNLITALLDLILVTLLVVSKTRIYIISGNLIYLFISVFLFINMVWLFNVRKLKKLYKAAHALLQIIYDYKTDMERLEKEKFE